MPNRKVSCGQLLHMCQQKLLMKLGDVKSAPLLYPESCTQPQDAYQVPVHTQVWPTIIRAVHRLQRDDEKIQNTVATSASR
eukprot:scaffold217831_cov35-Prasinocladus_malaysianus.AAC.1